MTQSQPAAALDHLRVLDLTNGLGQMCPRALGDLGADVIKIEPPEGDPTRRMGPFAGDESGPERSLRFIHANRSKRSAVVDLDTTEGRETVRALAERADILVEDRQPGYLAGLGLGYDKLRELNPGLVYVSITPFGQTRRPLRLSRRRPRHPVDVRHDDCQRRRRCASLHGALRDHGTGRLRAGRLWRAAGHPRAADHRPRAARRPLPAGGHPYRRSTLTSIATPMRTSSHAGRASTRPLARSTPTSAATARTPTSPFTTTATSPSWPGT